MHVDCASQRMFAAETQTLFTLSFHNSSHVCSHDGWFHTFIHGPKQVNGESHSPACKQ